MSCGKMHADEDIDDLRGVCCAINSHSGRIYPIAPVLGGHNAMYRLGEIPPRILLVGPSRAFRPSNKAADRCASGKRQPSSGVLDSAEGFGWPVSVPLGCG